VTHQVHTRPIEILLVDDNPADVRLAKEAMKDAKVWNRIYEAYDGDQAMAFLNKQDDYSDAPTPDLVILDLNMPRKDGREVLAEMRADERFTHIPVVILTTSAAEEDVMKSYGLHANCYVVKPFDLHSFIEVVKAIEEFWLCMVMLPGVA